MKKPLLLTFAAMTMLILLCSCAGHNTMVISGHRSSLVIPSPPSSSVQDAHRGVVLSVSNRSSVKIDVEGILGYVQGAPALTPELAFNPPFYPWISWTVSF